MDNTPYLTLDFSAQFCSVFIWPRSGQWAPLPSAKWVEMVCLLPVLTLVPTQHSAFFKHVEGEQTEINKLLFILVASSGFEVSRDALQLL